MSDQKQENGFTRVNSHRSQRTSGNQQSSGTQRFTGNQRFTATDEGARSSTTSTTVQGPTRLYPRFVVTRNGAIALYNLQRDPIILYADQWERLSSLIRRDILDNYIAKNTNIIKRRPARENHDNQEKETDDSNVVDTNET